LTRSSRETRVHHLPFLDRPPRPYGLCRIRGWQQSDQLHIGRSIKVDAYFLAYQKDGYDYHPRSRMCPDSTASFDPPNILEACVDGRSLLEPRHQGLRLSAMVSGCWFSFFVNSPPSNSCCQDVAPVLGWSRLTVPREGIRLYSNISAREANTCPSW
jgi:hypothetical protein